MDKTGWVYVQFLNITAAKDSIERIKISQLSTQIRIETFNLVAELLPLNANRYKQIVYIQVDLTKCLFFPALIDWNLIPAECDHSVRLTYELLKFYSNRMTSPEHCCYFRVESMSQMFSTVYSTQMRHMKARLRADIKAEFLIDPSNPNARPFYFIISLLGKHMFYYNFMHDGHIYSLKSEKPIQSYLNISAGNGHPSKSVVSILQIDDTMRIYDEIKLPNTLIEG